MTNKISKRIVLIIVVIAAIAVVFFALYKSHETQQEIGKASSDHALGVGVGNMPNGVIKIAKDAIQIADEYLGYEIDNAQAYNELGNSHDNLAKIISQMDKDNVPTFGATSISMNILLMKTAISKSDDSTRADVIEYRNSIAKSIDEPQRK